MIARRLHRARGMTLLEIMVSISILALVGTLIYGALDGMQQSRSGIGRMADRYHQGRTAIGRMSRELQSAYISMHNPPVQSQWVRTTSFIGSDGRPADRVDFNSFSNKRLLADAHESDQIEVSFFGARDPEVAERIDLVRRVDKSLDLEPDKGGIVQVLAEDIESLELEYLEPLTGEWVDTWDSTQAAGQFNRLPGQVRITLVLRGGIGDNPVPFSTKVPLAMQSPLSFGIMP